MLNKNVINVLQALNNITNSVVLKYPVSILNSVAGDVVVRLNVESLDKDAFEPFGIYQLSEFLSTFKLFDEYTASISDNVININGGDSSIQYLSTKLNVLENHDKSETLITSTQGVPSVATLELSKEHVKTIKSASGVFKDLTDIVLESQDGSMTIKLGGANNFNARTNSFSIHREATTTKEFSVRIPSENFNSLPTSSYKIEVKYNESKDAYRVIAASTEIDMQILLAVKK